MKELIYPVKTVYQTDGVVNTDALYIRSYPQIDLAEKHLCVIPTGGALILDYGMEYAGGIRILAHGGSNKVRIRVGESVAEACADLTEKGACNDHSLRDITVEIPSYSDNEYFNSGFRFIRIDNLGDKPLSIKKVLLVFKGADLTEKGGFICDDERINSIFSTAVRTLYLNAQNGVLYDGIKRDRLVWVGDLHPEFLAFLGLYDDYGYLRNCLEFIIEQTPLPAWMNGFPTYTQWFLVIVSDYITHSGDLEFLDKHKDYLYGTAKQVTDCINKDGKLNIGFLFLDWPSSVFPDKGESGIAGLIKKALESARSVLAPLGYDFTETDRKLKLLEKYYDKPCEYKQGAGIRAYAGLNQSADVMVKDGAKGFSTFMSYYLLSAVAKEYGSKTATDIMKEYYGGMLDLGATTFFEDFNIDWLKNAGRIDQMPSSDKVDVHGEYGDFCYKGYRHSLCHGWSSGVIQYLQRVVAGITVLDVGCKKISVRPDAGGLKWFKAKFPTPYGVVQVDYSDGKTSVTVPDGVELV